MIRNGQLLATVEVDGDKASLPVQVVSLSSSPVPGVAGVKCCAPDKIIIAAVKMPSGFYYVSSYPVRFKACELKPHLTMLVSHSQLYAVVAFPLVFTQTRYIFYKDGAVIQDSTSPTFLLSSLQTPSGRYHFTIKTERFVD